MTQIGLGLGLGPRMSDKCTSQRRWDGRERILALIRTTKGLGIVHQADTEL